MSRFVKAQAHRTAGVNAALRAGARQGGVVGPPMRAMGARAHRAGIKVAFGTDIGVSPHGENAEEFAPMVSAGRWTPSAPPPPGAEHLRLSDVGALTPGKHADLIAVASDPLADVTELERVRFVVKGDEVLER